VDENGSDWRKATASMANGNCVEIKPVYRKSSRSLDNPAACVEVAAITTERNTA
jgi:hypothetical protein